MRLTLAALLLLSLTSTTKSAEHLGEPGKKAYVKSTFGRPAIVRSAASATVGQIRNAPHEWGRGATGFGKRFGSAVGTHVVKNTVQFGVAAARHEDLRYHPSSQPGFGPRMKHALVSTVWTTNTRTGKGTVATGRISGNVAAGFVSRVWQPARLRTVGSGAVTSGILLGADAGSNVVREFWPEIRHPRRAMARKNGTLARK